MGVAGLPAEFGPEFLGGGHDQGFEVVDGAGAGGDGAGPSADQHAEGFAVPPAAWRAQVLAAEGFSRGSDHVDPVAFASCCSCWPLRARDLDHLLAVLAEEDAQPCAVATGTLHRPRAGAWDLRVSKLEQSAVAVGAGGYLVLGDDGADRCHHRRGQRVAVGVDSDDGINGSGENAHDETPFPTELR